MARRIRDPAEIQELVKFGEFFIEVDFQKKEGLKTAKLACGDAKEDCYEEKNLNEEFYGSWAGFRSGRGGCKK